MFFSGSAVTTTLLVSGHEYTVVRAHLQKYLLLEQLRSEKDVEGYLEQCGIPINYSGIELLKAYNFLIRFNAPSVKLPVLTVRDSRKHEEAPWDYLNRHIVAWVHLSISQTSMTLSEVLGLDIDDFFALLQEVLVAEQLEKEWTYGLSEIAYQYDSGTKTSRFVPLNRPVWMMNVLPKRRVRAIPDFLMPKGIVISHSNNASKSSES